MVDDLKVGDKVIIKDLNIFEKDEFLGITHEMFKYIGKIYTINSVDRYINLKGNGYAWNKRWLKKWRKNNYVKTAILMRQLK